MLTSLSKLEAHLQLAQEIYTSFDAGRFTLDSHLDTALSSRSVRNSADEVFLRQVVCGVTRFEALVKATTAALYHYRSGNASRNDRHIYAIFTYLVVIRLDDLGVQQLKTLVCSQPAQKMLVWMEFIFDQDILRNVLREDWLKIYDKSFVDGRIGAHCELAPLSHGLFSCLG
jgi:hypothetical protein